MICETNHLLVKKEALFPTTATQDRSGNKVIFEKNGSIHYGARVGQKKFISLLEQIHVFVLSMRSSKFFIYPPA